jgi:hypothetical protein
VDGINQVGLRLIAEDDIALLFALPFNLLNLPNKFREGRIIKRAGLCWIVL